MRHNHWMSGLTVVAVIALSACTPDTPAPVGAAGDKPIAIRVAEAVAATTGDTITTVGTVRLRREMDLGFTSSGRIAAIAVNEGDRVSRGQLLASLDATTVGADLAAAAAERTRASAELDRSKALFAKGWLTRSRLDAAEAAHRSAAAAANAAGYAARTARIYAPANGTILRRAAEVGQVVSAGTPVIAFGDASAGYVLQVPLADRQAATLDESGPASVRIAALGDTAIPARIVEIAGRADEGTGTFNVELALPASAALRSGQIGSAELNTRAAGRLAAVVVPTTALFAARAGEAFVYVVDPATNRVRPRKVIPGPPHDAGVILTAGLARGERVAVSGINLLSAGARVAPSWTPRA